MEMDEDKLIVLLCFEKMVSWSRLFKRAQKVLEAGGKGGVDF